MPKVLLGQAAEPWGVMLTHKPSRMTIKACSTTELIHDGTDEVLEGFPQTTSGTKKAGVYDSGGRNAYGAYKANKRESLDGSSGSAARFFYTAKASNADRTPGNNHPTVKPVNLMRYLVRLVCPAGGLVLDPFNGSGTTTYAAREEGCRAVGIELSEEYCDIAVNRLRQYVLTFEGASS